MCATAVTDASGQMPGWGARRFPSRHHSSRISGLGGRRRRRLVHRRPGWTCSRWRIYTPAKWEMIAPASSASGVVMTVGFCAPSFVINTRFQSRSISTSSTLSCRTDDMPEWTSNVRLLVMSSRPKQLASSSTHFCRRRWPHPRLHHSPNLSTLRP